MLARGLAEALRIGRELVPEAVEVDPLAAGDQPLGIRALEREMPERARADDLVPGPDPGQRRVHDHEAGDPPRKLRREGVADHVADVVGDEVGPVDRERIEDARDVPPLGLLVVAALGPGREAHAAQVGCDHGVIWGELGCERRPHVAGLAIAVQQQDRRPLAADAHVEGRAVGRDLLGPEARRVGFNQGRHFSSP